MQINILQQVERFTDVLLQPGHVDGIPLGGGLVDSGAGELELVQADLDFIALFQPAGLIDSFAVDVDPIGAVGVDNAVAAAHALNQGVVAADHGMVDHDVIIIRPANGDFFHPHQVERLAVAEL